MHDAKQDSLGPPSAHTATVDRSSPKDNCTSTRVPAPGQENGLPDTPGIQQREVEQGLGRAEEATVPDITLTSWKYQVGIHL